MSEQEKCPKCGSECVFSDTSFNQYACDSIHYFRAGYTATTKRCLESQLAAANARADEAERERDAAYALLHHIGGPEGFKGYLPCLPGHIAWEGREYMPDTIYDWLNISLAMFEGGWDEAAQDGAQEGEGQ